MGEECLTLNEYASNSSQYFVSNTTFVFLQGDYQLLDVELKLEGLQNISLIGETEGTVKLSFNPQASLSWMNCKNIEINSISISIPGNHEYVLMFANTTGIDIFNTSFIGTGSSLGCSSLVFQSSRAQISDTRFIGLSNQLGGVTVTSQSLISFSGRNVFEATLGSAVYSADSEVVFVGSNIFTNNHAAAVENFVTNMCSNNDSIGSSNPTGGFGGALFAENSNLILMNGSFSFVNNSAEVSGGALAVINSSLTIATTLVPDQGNQESAVASFLQNRITADSSFQEDQSFSSYRGSGGCIYAESSTVDISGASFRNNTSPGSGGAMHFNHSNVTMNDITIMDNSAFIAGGIRVDNEANVEIYGNNSFGRNSVSESGGVIYVSNMSTVSFNGENYFNRNTANRGGGMFVLNAIVSMEGVSSFIENYGGRGGAVYVNAAQASFDGMNYFRRNSGGRGGAVFTFEALLSFSGATYFEDNSGGRGGALYLSVSNSNVNFYGSTYFYRNRARSRGGVFFLFLTTVTFSNPGNNIFEDNYSENVGGVAYLSEGRIILNDESSNSSFSNNTANTLGGVVVSYDGYLQLRGTVSFTSNKADFGGALALYGTSRVMLKPRLSATFATNQAKFDGGAIYFEDSVTSSQCINVIPIECFLTIGSDSLSDNISLDFTNNTARISGNSLYGGQFDSCRLYFGLNLSDSAFCQDRTGNNFSDDALGVLKTISTISIPDISSAPVRLCACKDNSSHSCNTDDIMIAIKPGQQFQLSLAALGQAQHVVNSTVLSKIVDFDNDYRLSPTVQSTGKSCTQVTYRLFSSVTDIQARLVLFFDGPCQSLRRGLDLFIDILPCPVGFKLLGEECVCEARLKNFTQRCFIDNSSIERTANNFWVSQQTNDSGPIDGLIIHQGGCPFDYCTSDAINVTLDNPNVQCDNNRSGILCGTCKENFSLTLGSLHCLPCSNAYVALIIPFILAGIVLVVILFLLRLTVAVGTLNGLIFYANIIQANHQTFFPRETINFFTVFIAWLNLDLGIETCFYDGMNIYAYSWLQFLFPFYVWLLILILILASRYSQKIASHLGQNPVAVLATLFLMSYSKILTAIITPLTWTYLKQTLPTESNSRVWLYDASIPYFRDPGHIVLGVFAIAALILLFLPYTILLLCSHWLQIKSQWRILSWINKLKPFMDAYHAPYKKQTRYWTGLLLLTRCGLFLTFAFNAVGSSKVNLLAVSSVGIALAVLKERVYEKHYNDVLESSFILNLCIFSIATLFITEEGSGSQFILSSISVGIAFVTFAGILLFHVCLQLDKTIFLGKVKTYLRNSRLYGTLFRKEASSAGEIDKSVVELRSIDRRTTELTLVESVTDSTVVVLREPLLESATY
jgi:predicted outer membrane repeat protein